MAHLVEMLYGCNHSIYGLLPRWRSNIRGGVKMQVVATATVRGCLQNSYNDLLATLT